MADLYRHSTEEADGIKSTEEEPSICEEHVFVISDDVTQVHDSVLHIQKLISEHLVKPCETFLSLADSH